MRLSLTQMDWVGHGLLAAALTLGQGASMAQSKEAPAKKEATRVQKTERLNVDGVAEYCTKLEAGQTVRYRFEADGAVDFNVHIHVGDQVVYPVKQDSVTAIEFVDFKPERGGDWCWMWTNRAAQPVAVRYTLFVSPVKRERRKS